MKETWEHVSVHWQQGKYQLWANCFMRWMPLLNRGPQSLRDTPRPHCCSQRPNHSAMTHTQNGFAPAERYHTLATTASRFWAGTIPHWTAYTWHWRIDIILYGGNMRTSLRARQQDEYQLWANCFLRWMPVLNRWPRSLRDTPCPPLL